MLLEILALFLSDYFQKVHDYVLESVFDLIFFSISKIKKS